MSAVPVTEEWNDIDSQSSCLYRASTVLRHYFIIPNWCT